MPSSPPHDATTTPPWARAPVLIGLLAVAVYLLMGVYSAAGVLSDAEQDDSDPFWLGRFKMFTDLRPHHTELRASVLEDGAWAELALWEVFPNAWQEGPGYHRRMFWSDPERLAGLAGQVCRRTDAEAVRLRVVRWHKTLASVSQPEQDREERPLLEQPCEGER